MPIRDIILALILQLYANSNHQAELGHPPGYYFNDATASANFWIDPNLTGEKIAKWQGLK